jgi:hypothetical protein
VEYASSFHHPAYVYALQPSVDKLAVVRDEPPNGGMVNRIPPYALALLPDDPIARILS